jgi:hypothetical protein
MSGVLAFLAGLQLPLGDNDWTNTVDVSPTLGLRAGVVQNALAGMVSVDFTPENLTDQQTMPNGVDTHASGYRLRLLAHVGFEHHIAPKLTLTGRAGAGIDIAHGSYDFNFLGAHLASSNTDTGYAFEFGGGVWWDAGSVQVGGELAVPIGHHDKASQNGSVGFVYTSYDLNFLFGIRSLL